MSESKENAIATTIIDNFLFQLYANKMNNATAETQFQSYISKSLG